MVNVGGKPHGGFGTTIDNEIMVVVSDMAGLLEYNINEGKKNKEPESLEHLSAILTEKGQSLESLQGLHEEGRAVLIKEAKSWGITLGDAQKLATIVAKTKPITWSMKYTRGFVRHALEARVLPEQPAFYPLSLVLRVCVPRAGQPRL